MFFFFVEGNYMLPTIKIIFVTHDVDITKILLNKGINCGIRSPHSTENTPLLTAGRF